MKKKNWMLIIVSVIMLLFVSLAFTKREFQNDTFYSIKVGQSILKNGIDMKDHFSWHDLSYSYPHWLYDIGVYKIYKMGGFGALYASNIVLFMIISVLFYYMVLRRNKSYFVSMLFSLIGMIMLASFITTRAQSFSYLLFLIEVLFIEKLINEGKIWHMVVLMLDCVLIANIHAAVWPFFFVLMLPYLVGHLVARISNKMKNKPNLGIFSNKLELVEYSYIKYLVLVFVICLALGMLTPIGDIPYTYFIKVMMGDSMKWIDEHKPLVLANNLFMIGYLLIFLVPIIFTKVRVRICDFFMICGLIVMTFMSLRHMSFLGVIGVYSLSTVIANMGYIKSKKPFEYEYPWYGTFIILVTMIVVSGIVFSVNQKKEYINDVIYPVNMVNWMNNNLDMNDVKIFNDYDFGSYLLFKNIPVYIDSRCDLYLEAFNGKKDIFDESMNITKNYGRVFKKYDITHVLIYKDTYLNQILAASPNYKYIHKEGRFILYEYSANVSKEEEKEA